jgi:hypothetical protein
VPIAFILNAYLTYAPVYLDKLQKHPGAWLDTGFIRFGGLDDRVDTYQTYLATIAVWIYLHVGSYKAHITSEKEYIVHYQSRCALPSNTLPMKRCIGISICIENLGRKAGKRYVEAIYLNLYYGHDAVLYIIRE